MANKGPIKANRTTSHFTAVLIVHFIWLTCSVHHSLWGLCRFAYHVLLRARSISVINLFLYRSRFFIDLTVRRSDRKPGVPNVLKYITIRALASRRSAVDGINGMGKHKKGKKKREKQDRQDKLERRERPGERNLHTKWSFIDCRHSHAWKLEGCYKS